MKELLKNNYIIVKKFIGEQHAKDLSTDFYDKKLNKVKTLPYKDNYGYFFSSGKNTWHGMEKKEIVKAYVHLIHFDKLSTYTLSDKYRHVVKPRFLYFQ